MPLSAEVILERIKLKSGIRKWRALAIVALTILAVSLVGLPEKALEKDFIARISISDIIIEDRDRDEIISGLKDNKHVKAVILYVNSPGGTTTGGETLYEVLRDLAEVKPVVSVMGTVATSAGYMVAITGERVFARKSSITGSIGVMLQSAEFTEMAHKLGIGLDTIKSRPLKGTPSPFEKLTPESTQALQDVIDDFYNVFVDMVSERRKISRSQVLKLADGRVYTGLQAFNNKLIDEVGGEKEALEWLRKDKKIPSSIEVKEVKLYRPRDEFKELFSSMTKSLMNDLFSYFRPEGLISIWNEAKIY